MTSLLDLRSISTTERQKTTSFWSYIEPIFKDNVALKLSETFPTDGFEQASRNDSTKQYRFQVRRLVRAGTRCSGMKKGLTRQWCELINELETSAYRSAITSATGVDVSTCFIEISLFCYSPGDWLSLHTDNVEKKVSQVFYFNKNWEFSWGGRLGLIRDNSLHLHWRLPRLNSSMIICRSDSSWHKVEPVSHIALEPRRTLNVSLWNSVNT